MKEKENYKKYIEENDEIRCWFKVTANRKKVWNIQIWLLEELKKICKKHNIKYYADWGTMLWAIRHWWFIPRDDDMDITMLRWDYEKFLNDAKKELPDYIKLETFFWWFTRLINQNTAALWWENWWNKYICWWIWIDIFPLDYSSKFLFINRLKKFFLKILHVIIISQTTDVTKIERNKYIAIICKYLFKLIDYKKVLKIYDKLHKFVIFKWNSVFKIWHLYFDFPLSVYKTSHEVKFENTTINIPDGYRTYLKKFYWDYMKPVIYPWWHFCWYSVDKSYLEIIKNFDKSKSDEENFSGCKDLFVL